jgi:serine/threonine protein kinase
MRELISHVEFSQEGHSTKYCTNYKDKEGNWYFFVSASNDYDLSSIQGTKIDKHLLCPSLSDFTVYNSMVEKNMYVKTPMSMFSGYEDGIIESIRNEIETYEKIRRKGGHKSICRYYGCIVENRLVTGIVIERGYETLFQRESMNAYEKSEAIEDLSDAVRFLHSIDIVHGDINPHNIMFNDAGSLILLDFDSCGDDNPKMGTNKYMREGYSKSKEDDIFSLQEVIKYIGSK